jgi:hypothetical protein
MKNILKKIQISDVTKLELICVGTGMIVGFIMQFASGYYLEKNKKLLDPKKSNKNDPVIVEPDKKIKFLDKLKIIRNIRNLRGGVFDRQFISTLFQLINEAGPILGTLGGFVSFITILRNPEVTSILYKSSAQNLQVKSLISIGDTKTALETIAGVCEANIGTIIMNILNDDSLSFEYKQKAIYKILTKHISLDTDKARVKFVLCIIVILIALYIGNTSGYIILLNQLYQAVKDGKINNVLFRAIIRKLKKSGRLVDPYLFD